MKPRLLAMGDSALLIKFGEEIDPVINQRVHQLDALLRADQIAGVIETVPAYATLLLHYDPLLLTYAQASEWVTIELAKVKSDIHRKPRRIEVPVQYVCEYGPDLDFIASLHHISIQEVISLHTGREYSVYMMGFTPGFAYMGKLDDMLATPRLETPRIRVAAGSVGIAGSQTGIYPIDSPGGWRLIGRTSLSLFDLASDKPFLFSPGDLTAVRERGAGCLKCWRQAALRLCRMAGEQAGGASACRLPGQWICLPSGLRIFWPVILRTRPPWSSEVVTWFCVPLTIV